MMKFIPYVLKTLWRHRSRTILTVTGSAVAIFVFCFVGAVQQGMNDLQTRQESEGTLISFQKNKFCPATSHLPQDYDQQIEKLDGVKDVVPVQVFTNNCRASLDVVVFYGVPPEKLRRARDFELSAGDWKEFEDHQNAAVIGQSVASRRGISVGDKFSIGDLSVDIAGIFRSNDPAEENYIYSHLEFLQRRKGMNGVGTVTQLEILLEDGIDPVAKCTEIDDIYRAGPVETDTRPKGVFQAKSLGDLVQLINMAHYLGYACVGLVLSCHGRKYLAEHRRWNARSRCSDAGAGNQQSFGWRRSCCHCIHTFHSACNHRISCRGNRGDNGGNRTCSSRSKNRNCASLATCLGQRLVCLVSSAEPRCLALFSPLL